MLLLMLAGFSLISVVELFKNPVELSVILIYTAFLLCLKVVLKKKRQDEEKTIKTLENAMSAIVS
jgi:hypothetical protein